MVSSLPAGSYDKVMEQLTAKFGDTSQTSIGVVAYLIKNDNGIRRSHIFYLKSTLMQKKLRGKAAVEDALTIACAKLIALVMCINMSIFIRNALKPNMPSKNVHIFTDSLQNLSLIHI